MKKIRLILPCVLLVALLATLLCACYVSKPAKMSDLIGTYELTYYTYKADSEPSEGPAENRLQTREIKAFLIVRADGTGAYVYQDKNTPLYAEGVKITYRYDDENPSLIDLITYDNGKSNTKGVPGGGKEPLGLTFRKKDKNLHYYQPALGKLRTYTTDITYSKKSKDTDMTYVNKVLKTNLAYPEFALNGLNGTFLRSDANTETPYEYYVVDLDIQAKKAVATFAYETDPLAQQTAESEIVVNYPSDNENVVLLTFLGNTYKRSLFTPLSTQLACETFDENGQMTSGIYFYYDGRAVSEIVRDYFPPEQQSDENETPAA